MIECAVKEVLDPSKDGIEYINVYSKGKTRLGRMLTNPSDIKVAHPTYGLFRSAEGLWVYLKTGCKHEDLRAMDGFSAMKAGKKLKSVWMDDFQREMMIGIICKIVDNEELFDMFLESTLPFDHFYVYESKKPGVPAKVQRPRTAEWMVEFLTKLRAKLQKDRMSWQPFVYGTKTVALFTEE